MEVVPESHEKALNALRGHLTGRRLTEESVSPKSSSESGSVTPAPRPQSAMEKSSLPPKKRKSFHMPEEATAATAAPSRSALALEPISPALPLEESRFPLPARPWSMPEQAGCPGYATYVNDNHASHLGFYTDLSRQYANNVVFAQTLLQQGHYYPRWVEKISNTFSHVKIKKKSMHKNAYKHREFMEMKSKLKKKKFTPMSVRYIEVMTCIKQQRKQDSNGNLSID